MKIFISWSADRSKYIANVLREWLPNVIQALEPFVSTQDIEKGVKGEYVISQQLEQCNVGIVILTPENQRNAWILFESGALSKIATAHLCTLLYDFVSYTEVKPPLASFQHTTLKVKDKKPDEPSELNKEELFELVKTINSKLPVEKRLAFGRLEASFKTWYPQFARAMKDIPTVKEAELPPERPSEDKLDEVLSLLRMQQSANKPTINRVTYLKRVDTAEADEAALTVLLLALARQKAARYRAGEEPEALNAAIGFGLVNSDPTIEGRVVTLTDSGRAYLDKLRASDPLFLHHVTQ